MEKTYKLRFHRLAVKEWNKLAPSIKMQFHAKLTERMENPRVPSAALRSMKNCYKIKLRESGYRLIYQVEDDIFFVSVIALGRRDRNIYGKAVKRLE